MPSPEMVFNGVNGAMGGYLTPPLPAEVLRRIALGQPVSPEHLESLRVRKDADQPHFGVGYGINAEELSSAGWGVIFPYGFDPAVKDALTPLLDHRRTEAARERPDYYKEFVHNTARYDKNRPSAFLPGDTPRKWLKRNGALANLTAKPEYVPYYLLIVAGPEIVPYAFQYELDIQYAVGRLWFEKDGKPDLLSFASYALSVVIAERESPGLPRRAVFFGTEHPKDQATQLSSQRLVRPLAERLVEDFPDWACPIIPSKSATKTQLSGLLGGEQTPAFLFTASHGMGFPAGDERQDAHQGALLCNDFQGPLTWAGGQTITQDHYFSASDVGDDARLLGLVAFHFACYGCGTPMIDDFSHVPGLAPFSCTTPRPVVSRLPQRLLGHPRGGALAVVGHVDRAWSCSFYGGRELGSQITTFRSTLAELFSGSRLGFALEHFNQYHASLGTEFGDILKNVYSCGFLPDPVELSDIWTADNDARNFVVLGDPAVRLRVVPEGVEPAKERQAISPITLSPKPSPATKTATTEATVGESSDCPQSFGDPAPAGDARLTLEQLLSAAGAATADLGVRVRVSITVEPPQY